MKTKKVTPADRVAVMRIVYVRKGLRNTMLMRVENLERIDAHTAFLRAENAHLKSVNEKGLAELALLHDRLRLAVEALKGISDHVKEHKRIRERGGDSGELRLIADILADNALRASGVEI